MNQQSTARPNITDHPREPAQKHTAPGRKYVRRASLLTTAAITCALTACTSNPNNPTTSPTPTASPTLVRPDTSEYPGIVFTGPPMTPEQAKIVDAVAKRDFIFMSMLVKEPKDFSELKESVVAAQAAEIQTAVKKSHALGYTQSGWTKEQVFEVKDAAGFAQVISCSDGSSAKRTGPKGILTGVTKKIRTVELVLEDSIWKVSASSSRQPDTMIEAEKGCM